MKKSLTLMSALLLPMGLAACAVGPDYRKPTPVPPVQQALGEATGPAVSGEALPKKWWHLFADPKLDALIEKALAHNTDIRVASANLQRARALLNEAGAARLPTTTTQSQYSYQRTGTGSLAAQGVGAGTALADAIKTDFYSVGFDASYELDLFGGVSRSIEAARGDLGAAQAGLDAARVSIAAETARTYAAACGFGAQSAAASETVDLQQRTLDLTQRLLSGGRGTQRDVDQATVLVEQARASIATFDAERRASLYALAVLTGEPPANADATVAACSTLPTVTQVIPVGDGQALLARRPDVRQAERTLAADTARIGVATAALYPSITLLGSISLGGAAVGDLGKSKSLSYSLGPLISWDFPFNGAARARVRENKAITEGSLASFDKAVLTALQETEQALARLKGALDREAALQRAMTASNSAAFIADKRFGAGSDSFLQLLDAQRSRASARASLASAQADRAEAQVALFKALGGGWEGAPEVARKVAD